MNSPVIDRFEAGRRATRRPGSSLTSAEVEFDQFEPSGDAELGEDLVQVIFHGLAGEKSWPQKQTVAIRPRSRTAATPELVMGRKTARARSVGLRILHRSPLSGLAGVVSTLFGAVT
jgi:hypothetical protein